MSGMEELHARAAADAQQGEREPAAVAGTAPAASQGGKRQFQTQLLLRAVLVSTLVAIAIIAQRNYYHSLWQQEQALQKELGDLRSESVVVGAELMHMGQESEVRARIEAEKIPLQSPQGPAKVIKLVK